MTIWKDMDDQVPGGVYLCQVSESVSCGACCGLYNVADPSRDALEGLLVYRTELFETVPRSWDDIENFGIQMAAEAAGNHPFADFHHCPYIGFIGANGSRVGCLLHPLVDGNGGIDFRGLSYYGGMACRGYFCPTFNAVPTLMKEMIRHAATDWYHYGLIITEADLLCAVLGQLHSRTNGDFRKLRDFDSEAFLASIRRLMDLKLNWPFQRNAAIDRVNYFFKDRLYTKPDVCYGRSCTAFSRYDEIFKNLVSVFHTADHRLRAEAMIDQMIDEMAGALCSS